MSGNQMILLGGSQAPAVDPYFYSVTSLLHGDGTNGGQNNTFLDSSSNNFTITRNGNTTQGSFSPFSQTGWSNYFDGSGDYLSVADNTALDISGQFTWECWVYFSSISGSSDNILYSKLIVTPSVTGLEIGVNTTGKFYVWINGSVVITSTSSVSAGQWVHLAASRDGSNNVRIFINGISAATAVSNSADTSTSASVILGANYAGSARVTGYISNFRLVKGTAVYTADFTVPATPLTAISGTSLLTCQANRFLDASSNAFAITRAGDVSVQPFSPFNPTTAYSTSAVGGSGYFDGSGDYLSVADNTAFDLSGSTSWCIETWVYWNSVVNEQHLLEKFTNPTGPGWTLYKFYNNPTYGSTIDLYGGASAFNSAVTPVGGQWYHVVVCRNNTQGRTSFFINGTRTATSTTFSISSNASTPLLVGARQGPTAQLNGYLSGTRIVKGDSVYDPSQTSITVPTAPLTAITNTSLLCNFTNGAIFDNAAVADYETVGNAQISTSVKKYGTGSIAFDGTGDYLKSPSQSVTQLGSGDWTIEFWLYASSLSATVFVFDQRSTTTQVAPCIYIGGASNNEIKFYVNGADRIVSSPISASTWYHVALAKTGNNTKLFINGSQSGSTYSDTNNYVNNPVYIGARFDGTSGFSGYIDDLRISNGVARYLYNFTPTTAEFPNIGGTVTLTADPYFDYTTLLLPGNGTNGAQNNTFLDSSTNAFSITRNGNTTQGTFSPFSQTGWSNYFDGSGDYLTAPSNAAFDFGTGDFTLEAWGYRTSSGAYGFLISRRAADVNYGPFSMGLDGSNAPYFACSSSGSSWIFVLTGSALPLNSWFHLAGVRNGNTFALYVNGTSVGTATSSASLMASSVAACIGAHANGSEPFAGYISNARIVKGTAVYTSNFTPSTTPLTAITNTSLLTCQSNRFIDNSTNNFTITRNGDVSVRAFSPFNPTAAWSAATNGGSGYFDGSGDYLDCGSNVALRPGTGDYTIELWVYLFSFSTDMYLFAQNFNNASTGYGNFLFYADNTTGTCKFFSSTTGSSWNVVNALNMGTIRVGEWTHFAVSRQSGTVRTFRNGDLISSTTDGSADLSNTGNVLVATFGATVDTHAYMSGIRFQKGTAQYTASFTCPTSPPTAITNTSLLLNFTNAGIYDATSKNDLETVGNAQISTTQSKFGGSSMYFDGTGDYLLAPSNVDLQMGTGDFTVEVWAYITAAPSVGARCRIYSFQNHAASQAAFTLAYINTSGTIYGDAVIRSADGTGLTIYTGTTAIPLNTWTHLAFTRYASTGRLFVNGILQDTETSQTQNLSQNVSAAIGAAANNTEFVTGYIQDLRVTKGIARYTTNFTPPTTAFLTL